MGHAIIKTGFQFSIFILGLSLVSLAPAQASAISIENRSRPATISKYSQVTAGIFRGGRPTAKDLAAIQQQDQIKTVIDLEDDTKVVDAENTAAGNLGMQFLSTPMNPYATPTDQEINKILAQLEDASNYPLFIHCHYGEDRTGLMIGLYRVLVQGWPAAQAYQEMLSIGFHPALTGLDDYFRQRTGYTGP